MRMNLWRAIGTIEAPTSQMTEHKKLHFVVEDMEERPGSELTRSVLFIVKYYDRAFSQFFSLNKSLDDIQVNPVQSDVNWVGGDVVESERPRFRQFGVNCTLFPAFGAQIDIVFNANLSWRDSRGNDQRRYEYLCKLYSVVNDEAHFETC